MLQSMTGYGKCVADFNDKIIHVEIKALNSKSFDLNVRIAPLYREKEMDIRQMLAAKLIRGKVDFAIWIEKNAQSAATPVNAEVVKEYFRQIKDISLQFGLPTDNINAADWMSVLLRLPDTLNTNEVEKLSDQEWDCALNAINSAADELIDFRKQEGDALFKKFSEKVNNIEELLRSIEPYENARVEKIKQRIVDNLEKCVGIEYDNNRLEQEMIYYIEKLDINEEKQRLKNHLDYFRETMNSEPGQGKKLGFIAQEMGREINTTGSKSNQAEMQNIVVKMKDELEQIKEQVLNVL